MPPENEEEEEVEVEIPAEEVEEVETDDEPSEGSDLSAVEIKEANNLYKLLKNPTTQKDVLRVLAKQAGVMEDPPSTPQEVKETKKDILKVLEDKLGPELKWLAPKLSGALEEILEQERETSQVSFQTIEREKVENDVTRISEKLNRETKGEYSKLESRMNQLANEILPAPGQNVEKYMRHLLTIAQSERKGNTEKNKLADKITRNATNSSERLRSVTDNGNTKTTNLNKDGKISLKDAVKQAAAALEKK